MKNETIQLRITNAYILAFVVSSKVARCSTVTKNVRPTKQYYSNNSFHLGGLWRVSLTLGLRRNWNTEQAVDILVHYR